MIDHFFEIRVVTTTLNVFKVVFSLIIQFSQKVDFSMHLTFLNTLLCHSTILCFQYESSTDYIFNFLALEDPPMLNKIKARQRKYEQVKFFSHTVF